MNAISMDERKAIYGPLYKNMTFFTVFHSVGHASVRGDQGHFGLDYGFFLFTGLWC